MMIFVLAFKSPPLGHCSTSYSWWNWRWSSISFHTFYHVICSQVNPSGMNGTWVTKTSRATEITNGELLILAVRAAQRQEPSGSFWHPIIHGGSINGGTLSHHPFLGGIFPYQPSSRQPRGLPWFTPILGNPHVLHVDVHRLSHVCWVTIVTIVVITHTWDLSW